MKQVKYTHKERVEWTKVNRPVVYEMFKDDLAYPARVKEILDFNEIPTGYMPDPITTEELTYRVRVGIEFLESECPGWQHRNVLASTDVVWVAIHNISSVRTRYSFQLASGEVLTATVKTNLHNLPAQTYWRKYVLREGGNVAGTKIV